jgi:hypothetical protein
LIIREDAFRTETGTNRGIVLPARWRQCEDWRAE